MKLPPIWRAALVMIGVTIVYAVIYYIASRPA